MNRINLLLGLVLLLTTAVVAPAIANEETPSGTSSSATVSGSVVSYTESTLVLRTDTGDQMIFLLGASTPRPATLNANDRVQIRYDLDPAGSMMASSITLQTAESSAPPSSSPSSSQSQYDAPSGSSQHMEHETGAMGSSPTSESRLPATASPLPIIGVLGLIGVGAGLLWRRRKKAQA